MTNRMSCAYRIALLPMTLSDAKGHFKNCRRFLDPTSRKIVGPIYSLKVLRSCVLYDTERVLSAMAKFLVIIGFILTALLHNADKNQKLSSSSIEMYNFIHLSAAITIKYKLRHKDTVCLK